MKPMRVLWASLIGVVVLCIGVFAWLTSYMSQQNEKTVSDVAQLCLEQTGTQIQLNFDTAMELYQAQLASLADHAQSTDGNVGEAVSELVEQTPFFNVMLYDKADNPQTVYGEALSLDSQDAFLDAATQGTGAITSATDETGTTFVVVGVEAALPMDGGQRSVVIAASLPAEEINDELSLSVGATQVYSHIIRPDGSFVISNELADVDNFFAAAEAETPSDSEVSADDLKVAVAEGQACSTVLDVDGTLSNVYLLPLNGTDWYLVCNMTQSLIADPVHTLVNQRFLATLAGCGLVLVAIALVFALYYTMTRRQMNEVKAARREADAANRAKSVFLSNMSHDIRTPMNAIVGLAEVASQHPDDSTVVQDCLHKIRLSSKHLLGLINDVLDMSKIESGKLSLNVELVSLRETADNIVGIIQPQVKAKSLKFDVLIENITQEDVCCDGVRLNQILLNLLSNALKFTPEGGSVSLSIAQAPSDKGADHVTTVFRVQDTGIGMAPEFLERIFESFERESTDQVRRTEGTGLGMAIVKSIVDKMDGSIDVQSEPGCGSVFTVTLDFECAEGTRDDLTLPAWNVLVVDDDEPTCTTAAAALEELGAHASWATSAHEACALVETRHEQGDDFHAALIDWKMPTTDGVECARQIKERVGGEMPILMISAYDWSEIEEEARQAGVRAFISKPLFKSTLYSALHRLEDGMPAAAPNKPATIDLSGTRVLLAEDQELNWEVAHALLEPYGLTLEWATNGRDAVERFAASEEGYYNAVLMDVQMPIMDGYEATRQIRALDRADAHTVPIVAMTANVFSQDIEDSLSCGMNAHTSKPIDPKSLARLLAEFLEQ